MHKNRAEIISIGNEVLAGYTVNTNATFISQQLLSIGLPVSWVSTIHDEHTEIIKALANAAQRADAVLVTGGLGPTPDDITKKTVCDYFNVGIRTDEVTLNNVLQFLKSRNIKPSEVNKAQALIPDCDLVLPNSVGTAPCLVFERDGTHFFFMPGVPGEMKRLVQDHILGYLKTNLNLVRVHTALLRTTGIPESFLYEKLKSTLNDFPDIELSFLPRYIGVDLRFRIISDKPGEIHRLQQLLSLIRNLAEKYIFTEQQKEMEEVLGDILRTRKLNIALVESFTGGLISDQLTNVPGSSDYFSAGLITYSNASKVDLVQVSPETLESHGAVSAQTALEMVRGVQERFSSHCSISTTGIAGPGGATETKPVGLCYVAARYGKAEVVKEFHFGSERLINKKRGAIAGMELLRRLILEKEHV